MVFLKRAIYKQRYDLKPLDSAAMNRAAHLVEDEQNQVEDIVEKYFDEAEDPSQTLQIIPTKAFSELCRRLVLNDDDDAAEKIIRFGCKKNETTAMWN